MENETPVQEMVAESPDQMVEVETVKVETTDMPLAQAAAVAETVVDMTADNPDKEADADSDEDKDEDDADSDEDGDDEDAGAAKDKE